jgi:glutaredoxin 3
MAEENAMPDIEIYTQPWCPYCARAVSLLTAKGASFREIDAPHGSAEREEATRRSGGRTTVPQIFIAGRHIGGCDDLVALDRAGKLAPLLQAG